MAYNSADQEIYGATSGSGISIISSASNTVVSTISDSNANGYLAFNPTDDNVFVSGSSTYVINGASLVTDFSTTNAGFIAYNPGGSNVYVSLVESPGYLDVISS